MLRQRLVPVLALIIAGAVVPGALLHFLGGHRVHFTGTFHFEAVGISAFAATIAAIALTFVGVRRRDPRTVIVGTAFSAMAALLCVHGLSTPGVLVGENGLVAFTGGATLPVGGAVLALGAVPSLQQPRGIRTLLLLQGALVVAILGTSALGTAFPQLVPAVPEAGSGPAMVLLMIGLALYALLAVRAASTFLLTRRFADLVVVVGVGCLAVALVAALTLEYYELGWWLGHLFELFGIVLVGAPVAIDLHRSAQSRPLAGDFRAAELVAAEEAFLGAQVRALTVVLADKDEYTEEHTRRVAMRAVEVGEELGLAAGRLRTLAIGGLVHDIGKLRVADEILKKPAALDEQEFAVIRRHPEWGHALLGELGAFGEGVRRLVLDHHERLDGSGYPRGLRADLLDLETKILAVCDVYDALISHRVYREAWTHHQAMSFLRDRAGTEYDRRCVEALERTLVRTTERHREPTRIAAISAP